MPKRQPPLPPARDDAGFIDRPLDWPQYPYLPVKKPAKDGFGYDFGVIFLKHRYTVFEAYLFSLPQTEEGFNALPKHEYKSAAEIVADGWIVD